METEENLSKIKPFLTRGNDTIHYTKLQAHVLFGRKWNTVLLYNGAVKKFLKFNKERSNKEFELPASAEDIYEFCLWAGRTRDGPTSQDVLSVTVAKYLHGLKAWHLYHFEEYPTVNNDIIKQMLIASKRIDATVPKRDEKKPVMLNHVIHLAIELSKGGEQEITVLDTVLIAFWGLARLGELCGDKKDPSEIVKREDVKFINGERREVTVILRGAKTAKPGETQSLQIRELNHLLCPVAALDRRLARKRRPEDPLFSYDDAGKDTILSKQTIMNICQKCWEVAGYKGLTGHSFRVGGASFRYALGVSAEDICKIGRWRSRAYRLYIKAYSKKEQSDTLKMLNELECNRLH